MVQKIDREEFEKRLDYSKFDKFVNKTNNFKRTLF